MKVGAWIKEKIVKPLLWGWRNNGFYVMEEDWDYLIILDACRYDVFASVVKQLNLKGKLEKRISRGSCTPEFLLENFRKYYDIVYVTANPYVSYYVGSRFYRVIPVWDFGWDDKLKTVPPDRVYESTLKALKYGKRMIIHFMQPHEPFITLNVPEITGWRNARLEVLTNRVGQLPDRCIWDLVREGKFDRAKAIKGYVDNLKLVMPYVVKLCEVLEGTIIVTSDHGEGFGEKWMGVYPIYGHPKGVRVKWLVEVPWFICQGEGSKSVEKELISLSVRRLKI